MTKTYIMNSLIEKVCLSIVYLACLTVWAIADAVPGPGLQVRYGRVCSIDG